CVNLKSSANSLKSRLSIEPVKSEATALNLSIKGTIPEQNEDILHALVEEHERQTIYDKNLISLNTARFIDERMNIIASELHEVEISGEKFKSDHGLIDVQADALQTLTKSSDVEDLLWRAEAQ